ncbi:hypothetical protein J2S13_000120 [Oikeobacillus pervagus]|uniref:DUF2663 family protein n=1 Tax=Oikeobacillus pervagus TaxID=1325931 RepID=A0AAJ1T1V6_9BACI|nr:YpbF family protein [Oikeobacillus pervagus]MDQ0213726.1 hypothetical protein [Oikeobacillus pervagus]
MDPKLVHFNNGTDQATKQMLQALIDRKRKFEQLNKRYTITMWVTVFFCFFYMYMLYKTIIKPYSYSFFDIFSSAVRRSDMFLLFIVAVALFGIMKIWKDQKDKAEDEFHALRCEIIDRSKDLWKNEAWAKRHQLFEFMKKDYGINLYHESK